MPEVHASPEVQPAPEAPQQAGYLDHDEVQLYWVRHTAARRPARGRVVLAGPLGDERMHAYLTWVRWARRLAASGYEVVRFDYRGQGESTGAFEAACLSDWASDLRAVAGLVAEGDGPLVLSGLRLGALLSAGLFAGGLGDALLAWGPPASGRAMLMDLLRRKLAEAMMQGRREKGRDRDWYVAHLEGGGTVEVNGYPWGERLWRDAEAWTLAVPVPDERRPWAMVRFDGSTPAVTGPEGAVWGERLQRPPFWMMNQRLVQPVDELFARSLGWLERRAVAAGGGRR